jgi:hypothetical protein
MKSPKPQVIRPGQTHAYRKGSHQEIDQRRGCVARLLAGGLSKMAIHRAVKEKFGCQWRTVDRDIAFVTGTACK